MKRIVLYFTVFFILASNSLLQADTFKNLTTGDSFIGFRTTKQASGKTLVFREDLNQFAPIDLSDYEVTYGIEGRRDSVMVISITQPEILLSQVVSQQIADSIYKAADSGTRALVIKIDNPGGKGAYMRSITEAIMTVQKRTDCSIAAYITGGQNGGAFSAAAIIALACDTVYMSPNAVIGAVGPISPSAVTNEDYISHLNLYTPDSLATTVLPDIKNRPPALAKALIDKYTTVVEVRDLAGNTFVVEQAQRTNDQTVVRVICEGLTQSSGDTASIVQGLRKLLNLTATEAVRLGVADKIVNSYSEVMTDLGLSDTQTVRTPGTERTIKKFNAAKRNINQLLTGIQQNENRIAILQDQAATIEDMIRTGTRIRQQNESNYPVNTNETRHPGSRTLRYSSTPLHYYDSQLNNQNQNRILMGSERQQEQDKYQAKSVTTEEPTGNIQQVQYELIRLLNSTLPMYRRAIGISRRWPGALPPNVTEQSLQNAMDFAQTMLINIHRLLNTSQ